eukprot:gene925-667_t
MGVPKFYRWLSERYPLINQMISGAVILPEIDNFYLDMNGIIHACTHPNDNHTANALSLREMMLSIFRYVDRIVTEIVKPKKLLFMAIDGVAPRAKLNQQRARRFRAAQDRLESIDKAKQRGEVVDEENMFDSNCITPGTEFMDHVSKHLKYYIRKKLKEDPLWRNLTVVFSGHDVPGEGEHKIMQYIRDFRASPSYEPNVRHCMYGQDADLIMLGLACHEPHFCLLREVINFNTFKRRSARETVMRQTEDAQFQLLHLSLLREYLALDFAYGIQHPVDQERIIDDFIFLTFLVGNDFLPHLPTLDISEHAFDVLINAYRQLYEENPGYIVLHGEINDYQRLEKLFGIIGSQEYDILVNRAIQNKEYKARMRKNEAFMGGDAEDEAEAEEAMQAAFEAALKEARGENPEDDVDDEEENGYEIVARKKPSKKISADMSEEEKAVAMLLDDDEEAPGAKKDFRGRYYFEKFRILSETKEGQGFLRTLMGEYLKGLGWCLAYYVKGCISWTWYYPYHYGPMLQDMTGLDELRAQISYDIGSPFTPYQQLLGCLPPASSSLLPKCYQWLMTNPESPVLHFYPMDFKIDQDGKKNPWEAVVLLDFINENKLLAAEAEYCPSARLTRHEVARNRFGFLHNYAFDLNITETYLSCNPEIGLPDIHNCNSTCSESEFSLLPGHSFQAVLMDGTVYPIAGFPSLTVLQLESIAVEAIKLDVFGSFSRYKTLVINLGPSNLGEIDMHKAELILGRSVFVNYPQMHEAKVIALLAPTGEYRLENPDAPASQAKKIAFVAYDEAQAKKWADHVAAETNFYLKGRSKPGTGGLNINETSLRLKVLPLQGMKRDPVTGSRKKIFSKASEADIPLQLALWQPTAPDNRFVEVDELPIEKLLPVGTEVVAISGGYTGFKGTVVGPHGAAGGSAKKIPTTPRKRVVDVEFLIPKCLEPPFGYGIARAMTEDFYSGRDVCSMLQITPSVLGKIVGSIRLEPGRIDLGLNLKRNGVHQLLGYIRKVENTERGGGAKEVRKVWTGLDTVKVVGMTNDDTGNGTTNGESVYWEYTSLAIKLMAEYKARFPIVFQQLQKLPHEAVYTSSVFLGPKYEDISNEIMTWMKAQPFFALPRVPLSTTSLSRDAMAAIERAADVHTTINQTEGLKKWIVKSIPVEKVFCDLYHTTTEVALPYNTLEPRLGDRVVNLCSAGVPFGLKGTVVTIHAATKYVEVIFDEEFIGGKSLQGNCSQFRGRLCRWTDMILVPGSAVRLHPTTPTAAESSKKTEDVSGAEVGNKLLSALRGSTAAKEPAGADSPQLPARAPAASARVDRGNAQYSDDTDGDAFLDALTDEKQQEMIERMIRQYASKSTLEGSDVSLAATLGLPAFPTLGRYADQASSHHHPQVASKKASGGSKHDKAAALKAALVKTAATVAPSATANAVSAPASSDVGSTPSPSAVPVTTTNTTAAASETLKQKLGLTVKKAPSSPSATEPGKVTILPRRTFADAAKPVGAANAASAVPVAEESAVAKAEETPAPDRQAAASMLTAMLKAPTAAAAPAPAPAPAPETPVAPAPVESTTVAAAAPAPSGGSKNLTSLLRNAKAAISKKTETAPAAAAAATAAPSTDAASSSVPATAKKVNVSQLLASLPVAPTLSAPVEPVVTATPPPTLVTPPVPPAGSVPVSTAAATAASLPLPPAPTLSTPATSVSATVGKKVDVKALFSVKTKPVAVEQPAAAPVVEGGKKKLDVKLIFGGKGDATRDNSTSEEAFPNAKKVDVSALLAKKSDAQQQQPRSQQQRHYPADRRQSTETVAKKDEATAEPVSAAPAPSNVKVSAVAPTAFLPSRIMLQKPKASAPAAAASPVAPADEASSPK